VLWIISTTDHPDIVKQRKLACNRGEPSSDRMSLDLSLAEADPDSGRRDLILLLVPE
jgi:hypothetical protein